MNNALKYLLVLIGIFMSCHVLAQNDMAQTMVNCLEAMDINRLADNFAPEMEISIQGEGGLINATQAKMQIYDFISAKGVKSCGITHNGVRETSGFCILSLKTADGSTYRLYSFYRQDDDGKMKIHQFRIDHD